MIESNLHEFNMNRFKNITCFEFILPNTSAHSITAKKATITRNARAKSQQPDTAGSAGSVSLGSLNWAAAAHLVTNYLWVVGCSLGCCVALVAACLGLPLLLQWCGDGTTRRNAVRCSRCLCRRRFKG